MQLDLGPNQRCIRFRASCSHADGTGHLRRCLTLAEILDRRGLAVDVVTDDNDVALHVSNGSPMKVRHINRNDLGVGVLDNLSVFVLDIPSGNDNLLSKQSSLEQIAECDRAGIAVVSLGHVALNLTHFRAVFDMYPRQKISAANYFEGPEYLILRSEFMATAELRQRPSEQILISMGGSDPFDLSRLALEALGKSGYAALVHVVLGSAYAGSEDDLRAVADQYGLKVECHRELAAVDFSALMGRCASGLLRMKQWHSVCRYWRSLIMFGRSLPQIFSFSWMLCIISDVRSAESLLKRWPKTCPLSWWTMPVWRKSGGRGIRLWTVKVHYG